MISETQFIYTSASLLAIAILWVYLVKVIPSLVIEHFRNEIFDLRARLFDDAVARKVPFNHPGYGLTRSILNGHIRFAHRLSLFRLSVFKAVYEDTDLHTMKHRWAEVEKVSTPEQLALLRGYQEELTKLVVSRLVFGSWLLVLFVVPVIMVVLARNILIGWMSKYSESLNTAALEEGELAQA